MKAFFSFVLLLCSAFMPAASAATLDKERTSPEMIDVVVLQKHSPQQILIDGGTCAVSGLKKKAVVFETIDDEVRACSSEQQCVVRPHFEVNCETPVSLRADDLERRHYHHFLRIGVRNRQLRVVVRVPLEGYVKDVLKNELAGAPHEAAVAQEIVIRTYALYAQQDRRHDDADLCDLTHCQVFAGREALASADEKGPVLVDKQGKPAMLFYTSTCGGSTRNAHDVWPSSQKTVIAVSDLDASGEAFCKKSPHFRWSTRISLTDLARVFRSLGFSAPGPFKMHKSEKNLVISTSEPHLWSHRISILAFHRAVGKTLGWHKLKSLHFEIGESPNAYYFSGHGLGHGVGMCQHGAMERARRGQTARQILRAYFPNLELQTSGGPQ